MRIIKYKDYYINPNAVQQFSFESKEVEFTIEVSMTISYIGGRMITFKQPFSTKEMAEVFIEQLVIIMKGCSADCLITAQFVDIEKIAEIIRHSFVDSNDENRHMHYQLRKYMELVPRICTIVSSDNMPMDFAYADIVAVNRSTPQEMNIYLKSGTRIATGATEEDINNIRNNVKSIRRVIDNG